MRLKISAILVMSLLLILPSAVAALTDTTVSPIDRKPHRLFERNRQDSDASVPRKTGNQEQADFCDAGCLFQYAICVFREGAGGACEKQMEDCVSGCHPIIDGIKIAEKRKTNTTIGARKVVDQSKEASGPRR